MNKNAYLLNGQQVQIHEKTTKGFLVSKIYECENREPVFDNRVIFVEKVFENAPTEKLDERIKNLNTEIDKLDEEKKQLEANKKLFETQFKAAEEDVKKQMAKIKQYQALKRIENFIEGKITHYVVATKWKLDLLSFEDTKAKEDWNYRQPGFKLLTLFGKTGGDLEWGLNEYKDGSGCNYTIIPCCSYEEAVEKLKEYLIPELIKNADSGDFELAEKHKIEIPVEAFEKRKAKLKNAFKKQKTDAEAKLAECNKELEKLEIGGITNDQKT